MKYAIEMTQKNFDADTNNIFAPVSDVEKRRNPKNSILGRITMYSLIILISTCFFIHTSSLFYYNSYVNEKFEYFSVMIEQSKNLAESYS